MTGVLVANGLGLGKTFTSVAAAMLLLRGCIP